MWIRRLAVEHWRGLTCTLDALSPGLNLIAGPNESGKSRLVQALRFALFESSSGKSAHKRELATWGLAPGKPRVTVDFELAGTEWRLEKVFLDTGHNTLLRGGGQTLEGETAEARLGEMLGFTPSTRAELKPEERGVWALLWVDQGASRDLPSHNETSQARITDQLSREIGEAAAGDFGQRVLRRAEEYRNRFYSIKRDDERSALSEPRQQVTALRTRLAQATARRDELADAADRLEAARKSQTELEARLAAAEVRHRALGAQLETAQTLRHRLEVAESAVAAAAQTQAAAIEKLRTAAALTAEIAALDNTIATETANRDRTAAGRDALQQSLEQAHQVVTAREAALLACDTAIAALRRRQQLTTQRELLARLREKRSLARRLNARIGDIRQTLAPLPAVSGQDVTRLRKAEADRDAARARLEGASVSLTLTAGTDLAIDGHPLAAGAVQQLLVIEDRRITVNGLLVIDVNPGGGEIAGLRDQFRDAERTLTRLLESFGTTDVETATDVARQRRDLESELAQISEQLAERAPEGAEALDRQVSDLQVALDAAGTEALAEFDATELAGLEARQRDLIRAQADARLQRDAVSAQLAGARVDLASISSSLEAYRKQHQRLAEARASTPDEAGLQAAVETAARAFGEQVAARDEARRLFEASGGDQAALDLEQAARSVKHLRDALQNASNTRIELETVLRTAGDDGRHEQVQELESELIDAETALARVAREAQAARRLHEILIAEYKAARERLTAPVIERIRPYLADLFPGSEVWLDDELRLCGLRSAQIEEDFEALSGGAREQLSLLVRIGLAEVLGAGESWPLVLDDVLVNTDAERIRRMQRALFSAARRMQILLFTCHGPLFDALGPDAFVELPAPGRRDTPA